MNITTLAPLETLYLPPMPWLWALEPSVPSRNIAGGPNISILRSSRRTNAYG